MTPLTATIVAAVVDAELKVNAVVDPSPLNELVVTTVNTLPAAVQALPS